MRCATCGRNIEKDDLHIVKDVGVTCYDCYRQIEKIQDNFQSQTRVGLILYVIAAAVFVAGLVCGIIEGSTHHYLFMMYYWVGAFVAGMVFIALGKIIHLLEAIYNKLQ